jgi:hypothetical protein
MPRPSKHPAEQRSVRLPSPRVTPAELAFVERQAITAGLTSPDYIRRLALGRPVAPRRSRIAAAMLLELNRIGVNTTQRARANTSAQAPISAELRQALAALRTLLERLADGS